MMRNFYTHIIFFSLLFLIYIYIFDSLLFCSLLLLLHPQYVTIMAPLALEIAVTAVLDQVVPAVVEPKYVATRVSVLNNQSTTHTTHPLYIGLLRDIKRRKVGVRNIYIYIYIIWPAYCRVYIILSV